MKFLVQLAPPFPAINDSTGCIELYYIEYCLVIETFYINFELIMMNCTSFVGRMRLSGEHNSVL